MGAASSLALSRIEPPMPKMQIHVLCPTAVLNLGAVPAWWRLDWRTLATFALQLFAVCLEHFLGRFALVDALVALWRRNGPWQKWLAVIT